MLGKWADERATQCAPATLANYIKSLRAAFRLAIARAYISSDPSAGLKIAAPRAARPRYLLPDQIALLLDCARQIDAERLCANTGAAKVKERAARKWYNADGTFDAARIRFLLLSGLRRSQMTSLTWSQYDRERGCIVLESRPDHTEKSKRVNIVPLPREARAIIDAQPVGAPYIFPNLRGARDVYIGFRIIRLAALVQQRGGWHFYLHLLRHTALTALLRHTHDIAAVQRYAGHSDVKTTARYAWVLDDELKAMTDDFNPMAPGGASGIDKH
ncbi:MAG: tyrosine-type recombinase/integrase [bacterium]|nr:tyrosine-type recombinase/integrase [bacterium]